MFVTFELTQGGQVTLDPGEILLAREYLPDDPDNAYTGILLRSNLYSFYVRESLAEVRAAADFVAKDGDMSASGRITRHIRRQRDRRAEADDG